MQTLLMTRAKMQILQPCLSAALAIGVALSIASISNAAHSQPLVVQGSTTFTSALLLPNQAEVESRAGQKLLVYPNKSSLGVLALLQGRADLAMTSSARESEVAVLKRSNPELSYDQLRFFEVWRVPVAFAVHRSNPVRSTTAAEMRRILRGETTNWRGLGGIDLPIRLVAVREGGGVQLAIEEELLDGHTTAVKDIIRVQIGTQVVKVVEQEPAALGLAQLGNLRERGARELVIEHPIFQVLKFVTLGEPSRKVRAVIDATMMVAHERLKE